MPAESPTSREPSFALLYVALFSQWIGFFAWNAGLAIGGFHAGSQVQLLQPFVTFALAAYFNDETITLQIVLFAGRSRGHGRDLDAYAQTARAGTREAGSKPPQLAAS